jgi:hypothetical protein
VAASKSKTPRAIGGENIIVICFVALMSVYLYESFYLVPTLMSDYVGPSMFPQIIAILGLMLAGIYFFQRRSAGAEGRRKVDRGLFATSSPISRRSARSCFTCSCSSR